ncbi:hypothetical protein ANCCAN_19574 [Ancylostoma caninum]|uniref:SCP domain-containing protein n=1 Tax=Ancylostoma caninum TaxID=29170 RepID=A0A368FSV4_ANCCA|nr:hypothetical protein ANCCAN_19574 [Ancylostoma caninum]
MTINVLTTVPTTTAAPTTTTTPPTTTARPTSTTTAAPTTTSPPTRKPWPKPNCGNPQLSNALRNQFLNTHNRLRGSLARGQTEKSKGWGTAPPARIIYRMKYNCDAESHAQQYVHSCRTGGLPEHTHPGYKVNRHVLNNPRATKEGAIQDVNYAHISQIQ